MVITLTIEQQEKILKWIQPINEAHGLEDVEPPGYTIEIDVGGPYGCYAWAVCGKARVELNEVKLELS
jgi:hypothetical protein